MTRKSFGSFHSSCVGIALALNHPSSWGICKSSTYVILKLATANSLANDKESTISLQYSVMFTGLTGSIDGKAASVSERQSIPNRRYNSFLLQPHHPHVVYFCKSTRTLINIDPTGCQTSQHVYGACPSVFYSSIPTSLTW